MTVGLPALPQGSPFAGRTVSWWAGGAVQHPSAGVAFKRGLGGGGLVRVQSHRRSSDGAFPVVRLSPQHFPPPHSISLDPHLNTRHFSKLGFCYFDQLVLNRPIFWILQFMILWLIARSKILDNSMLIGAINGTLQPSNNYTKFWKLEISMHNNSCFHVVHGRLDTYPCKKVGTAPRPHVLVTVTGCFFRPPLNAQLRSELEPSDLRQQDLGYPTCFNNSLQAVCVITGKLVHVFYFKLSSRLRTSLMRNTK